MSVKIGLKDVGVVTFFNIGTGEILVYNAETNQFDGTGEFREPETELIYPTEVGVEECDNWWENDYACENGCCSCCGCTCYDYDYEDEEDDLDE
jgi:hypothetical protein